MRIVLIAALFVAPAAAAQGSSAAPKPAKPKMICQPSQDTGTRLGGKICKTAEQWEADRVRMQNDVDARRRQTPST